MNVSNISNTSNMLTGFIIIGLIFFLFFMLFYALVLHPCIQKKKALKDLENGQYQSIDDFLNKYSSELINDKEIRSYFQLNLTPPLSNSIPNFKNIQQSYDN